MGRFGSVGHASPLYGSVPDRRKRALRDGGKGVEIAGKPPREKAAAGEPRGKPPR